MLPNEALSVTPVSSVLLAPRNVITAATESQEMGGINLNDTSHGLQYQVWTCTTDGVHVTLSSATYGPTVQFTGTDITEVNLAFDQNMRPFVAFVDEGIAKYWWFDTVASEQTFTTLPAGSINPRATLDDKRQSQLSTSDIILAYINAGVLYFRAQRDRYTVDYFLKSGIHTLRRIGMGTNNRLMFDVF